MHELGIATQISRVVTRVMEEHSATEGNQAGRGSSQD
jgi:hypothetical protein